MEIKAEEKYKRNDCELYLCNSDNVFAIKKNPQHYMKKSKLVETQTTETSFLHIQTQNLTLGLTTVSVPAYG